MTMILYAVAALKKKIAVQEGGVWKEESSIVIDWIQASSEETAIGIFMKRHLGSFYTEYVPVCAVEIPTVMLKELIFNRVNDGLNMLNRFEHAESNSYVAKEIQ